MISAPAVMTGLQFAAVDDFGGAGGGVSDEAGDFLDADTVCRSAIRFGPVTCGFSVVRRHACIR
jgi:hypothetical protein